MTRKRNPITQIMSQVHKDVRAGKLDLRGHDGFVAELKRRIRAAGLNEDDMPDLKSPRAAAEARD
jgi:hypothetical protein